MNTWIFQGNPRVFNIDRYVTERKQIWWSLRQRHFQDQIQIGDEVFLWRSDGGNKESGGILAKAIIIGLPQERTDEDAREYWYTQDWNNPALGVKLEIEEVRLEDGFLKRTELMKNPILEGMLIFRLRQQTNYLLEESHADELRRIWNSQGNKRSFSWLRVFPDVAAVKKLDKSAFLHNGTGVPVDMRDFFQAQNMGRGERKEIVLSYKADRYSARLEMDNQPSPRTRLMWKSDFTNLLRNTFPDVFGVFQQVDKDELKYTPKLRFERLEDDNHYRVILIGDVDVEVLKMDIKAEDIENEDTEPRVEGKSKIYYGKRYERDPYNRKRAIEIHGYSCIVCGFNFEKVYGERGKDFIEVHHVKPLSSLNGEEEIDPKTDLVPLCSNCHRMAHRRHDDVLSIMQLKGLIKRSK